jgi:hypothetical protein
MAIICSVQQCCVMHFSKVIIALAFFSAVDRPSALSLLTLLYLLFVLPRPGMVIRTRLVLLLWMEV